LGGKSRQEDVATAIHAAQAFPGTCEQKIRGSDQSPGAVILKGGPVKRKRILSVLGMPPLQWQEVAARKKKQLQFQRKEKKKYESARAGLQRSMLVRSRR